MIEYLIKWNIQKSMMKSLLFVLSILFFVSNINSQQYIKTTDDLDVALDTYKKEQKLILAVYTEDRELKSDYFEYLEWHDSLVDLINNNYVVYTEVTEYNTNAVELLYSENGLLSNIELEEDQEDLYKFLKSIVENKAKVERYIKEEEYRKKRGKFSDVVELYSYLTVAKDIFEVPKEFELDEYLSSATLSEVIDSQDIELIMFHTQSMTQGYTFLKQLVRTNQISDPTTRKKIKETVKEIMDNTYLGVLELNDEDLLFLLYREFNWFVEQFESQEWNNRYKYNRAKYALSNKKKGKKDMLFEDAKNFIDNWLIRQITSNAPFMTAEDIAYDLASITDLLIDRKISKSKLPTLLPWAEESVRIYSGYQIRDVYARLLDKLGEKKKAKIEKQKVKWYKSKLSKNLIKQSENKFKDALDSEMILINFLDSYFYPELYVMP